MNTATTTATTTAVVVAALLALGSPHTPPIESLHTKTIFGWPRACAKIQDHEEPDLADYNRGVAFIEKWHRKGGKVLVHCKAGHGRSSAIVMGWLLASDRNSTPREVQTQMSSKRRVRKYLYKQLNLRLFYRGLQTSADGTGKDREKVVR